MKQILRSTAALVCLAFVCNLAECRSVEKRSTHPIDPHKLKQMTDHSIFRDKRKVEVAAGVKNAVLGFVFNKLNSFIDQKTAWVEQLDKTNIAKNEAQHIYPPKDPILTLSDVISGAIGDKLQAVGPILSAVTGKLGTLSSSGAHNGFNFGALLNKGFGASNHGAASVSAHASSGYGAAI